MRWEPPVKFTTLTEKRLVSAILDGVFPVDSSLPGERELAAKLGVTRPTLRESLQRMGRDGWIEIQQGRPTRVRNFWEEGNLAVLAAIAENRNSLPADLVHNLLEIRVLMAPEYTRQAIQFNAPHIASILHEYQGLSDDPQIFSSADWELHRQLTLSSRNPIFILILNGFHDLYPALGLRYFSQADARQVSREYYAMLLDHALQGNVQAAGELSHTIMLASIKYWDATIGTTPENLTETIQHSKGN